MFNYKYTKICNTTRSLRHYFSDSEIYEVTGVWAGIRSGKKKRINTMFFGGCLSENFHLEGRTQVVGMWDGTTSGMHVFHADGPTDTTKLIIVFRNFKTRLKT
jgi:hypothetical protein